jgi:ribosome-binding factor A
MDTTRQQKINRLIQKELSEIFRKETQQMRGVLVTVSTVRVSPDLGLAKVYLSIFPSGQGKDILANIKTSVKTLRYNLGQKIGKQLRIVPELSFYLDDSLDYLENIDRLLNSDKKEE